MHVVDIVLHQTEIVSGPRVLAGDWRMSEYQHMICGHCESRTLTTNKRTGKRREGRHRPDCYMYKMIDEMMLSIGADA